MSTKLFDIFFRGRILEDQKSEVVQNRIEQAFKFPEALIKRMFSGHSVIIKKAVDIDAASHYQLAFRKLGAILEVRASATQTATSQNTADTASTSPTHKWTLNPANTGTLEDCITDVPPKQIPDISHMTMATPGAKLDKTDPHPTPKIAIGNLDVVSEKNWSLEDCQILQSPQSIRDQYWNIEDQWEALDENPPPTMPNIDTSALNLINKEGWTLEDCEAATSPDFSINLDSPIFADTTE
ncbi:hypothetical protein TI05_13975 [Achromatium sp. WMS3]|nr:hypothetical protein TI05_13975 [Achromatium sp. WMS3]